MTEFVDIFPTLCELAGLDTPERLDGESLVGLMRGENSPDNPAAVSQYMRAKAKEGRLMGWAIRTPRYRYVEWRKISYEGNDYVPSGEVVGRELYDYIVDPKERRNLAASMEHGSVLAELVKEFDNVLPYLPERCEEK